ncbi:MAG: GAF domain-containing protein [Acidobacteria bacterium]|nr:GAF domain-containing protein [Acidobacteriota bacterium]
MNQHQHHKGVLAGNLELLAGIFAGISETILIADAEGHYLDANPAATELLGYSKAELLHMCVTDVVADDRQAVEAEYARYRHDGAWRGEYELITKSGKRVPTEIRAQVITLPQHTLYVSIIRNISERKAIEAALRDETEINETIHRLGSTLSAELDLHKLVQAVTEACTELTGARFGSFFYNVLDQRGGSYMLYALAGVPRQAFAHFPMPRATDLFGPTFRGEGTIRIDDVKQDPRYGNNSPYYGMPAGHLPVTSYLAVPVLSRSGEVIGGLFFAHPDAAIFTARHERIVEGLAAQIAVAMDNARLFEAAQQARTQSEANERYYRLLTDAMPQIVWTALPNGEVEYVNRGWHDYTGLALADARGDGWATVVHPDDARRALTLWQQAVESGELYQIIYRLRRAADGAYRWHLGRALPLRDAAEQVIKWFGTCTDIDDQKRTEESIEFLSEASKALTSSLDYEETLKLVARLAVPKFADWCAVDMLTADGAIHRLAVEHKDPDKVALAHELQRRYPTNPEQPGPLQEVLHNKKSLWAGEIPDALLALSAQDAEHLHLLRSLGLKSYILTPLVVRDQTLGVITFVSAESGRLYDEDDLAFAEQLAQRAALAMDNATLFKEARQALQVREQAVELHRAVEERLSLLVQASDKLIGSPTLSDVLPSVLSLSRQLVAAHAYAVWRMDAAQKEWRIVSSAGLSDAFRQSVIAISEQTPSNLAVVLRAEDVYAEPLLSGRLDLHQLEGIASLLAAPLTINGRFSGTLTFYYHQPHHFSELEVRVATALSNMAAAAIGNAELYEEQRRMRAEAEEANRIKDEFLATVSHELRTPLNAIMGWTQILRLGNLDADATLHAVEVIERNAKSQAQIINDIMDVSRIITGKLRLEVQPVQLDSVIAAALDTIRPAAQAKGVRIESVIDSSAGQVSGDTNRLQQAVWNLLSNAVKFTPRGGRVQIRLERVNSHIEITVSDTGSGIRQDFLPYVFDRFRQADSSMSRAHGGLGLGLAIVRHLIEAHGGTVQVYSEGPDQGSTFTVKLPIIVSVSRAAQARTPANADEQLLSNMDLPSLRGLKILLVDDEADARELLQLMLTPCHAEVIAVASTAAALEKVKHWQPDLIVSDIGMPGEDGYSLIRKLRASTGAGSKIPAIALTAYARSEDRVKALSLGYQLHVPKPVEIEELVFAIASLAGRIGGES